MSITTLEEAVTLFGVTVDDHHDLDSLVPVVGFGRQGDVIVIPAAHTGTGPAKTVVPAAGVAVVRGENGGNTHLLLAAGDVRFDRAPASDTELLLGVLTVGQDSTAYLAHPEHAYIGFGPGDYAIRRQREQRDLIELVQD